MNNDTIQKTLIVTVLLCLVCSIVVSATAVGLRPVQKANREHDVRVNILEVAGLYRPGVPVEQLFSDIEKRVVNLDDGSFADVDPAEFDMRRAARDPEQSEALSPDQDLAQINRRPNLGTVYLVRRADVLSKVILPVSGYGLWSTLHGFLALEADGDTIYGLQFYEHRETPGLGGEVDNPKWRDQWRGKRLGEGSGDPDPTYQANGLPGSASAELDRSAGAAGYPRLSVIKGRVGDDDPDAAYKVDGLSGATLTSRGVSNMIRFWTGREGYRPFLERIRNREIS